MKATLLAWSAGATIGLAVGWCYGTVWARPFRNH